MLYYVRQKSGTVRVMDVEKLADAIEANSSLTAGDVKHAIEAFVEQLRLSLTQGDKVKIDGLGTFHITLCSEGTEKEKDCTVRSIRKVSTASGERKSHQHTKRKQRGIRTSKQR